MHAVADGIGEDAFEPVACLEDDGTLRRVCHELDQQAVVLSLFTRFPEHAGIVVADAFHRDNGNLDAEAVFHRPEQAVDACRIVGADDPVGVADVVVAVRKAYVRDCLDRIGRRGGGRQPQREQQEQGEAADTCQAHSFHLAR